MMFQIRNSHIITSLSYLLDWNKLVLISPGKDSSYDNCTTTLDSQPVSPLPTGDGKPLVGCHELPTPASLTSQLVDDSDECIDLGVTGRSAREDNHLILETEVSVHQNSLLCPCREDNLLTAFDELATPTLSIYQNPAESTECSYAGLTVTRECAGDDSILKVDVSMSPQSLQKATQTCLTPSEWQSVSDMPRINRTPYTNQTQRITPLKEKVRRSKQRSRVQYTDLAVEGYNNFNSAVDSASSNCSTVSTIFSANSSNPESSTYKEVKYDTKIVLSFRGGSCDESCEIMTASSSERTQSCENYFKTGTIIDGENSNFEEVENVTSNFSDISSRDEQFIESSTELDPTYSASRRGLDDKISGSIVRGLNDISSKLNMSQIYIESDTDSDNDLGHFYVPSPLSNRCISENRLVSSSLGYISSYPSIAGKNGKCDIMK
jgi:hypothetical protein